MAIIDTSKGVRPCVEELSWYENVRGILARQDIQPLFSMLKNPDIFKPEQTKNGVTFTPNSDGTFTINGTTNRTNTALSITNAITIENASLFDGALFSTSFANYLILEPILTIPFYSEAPEGRIEIQLAFTYYDKNGTTRVPTLTATNPNLVTLTILKDRTPLSNDNILINATILIRQSGVAFDNFIIGVYPYLLSEYGFDAYELLLKKFSPQSTFSQDFPYASGFTDINNAFMYDCYLNKNGVTYTDYSGIKYYHDSE